MPSPFAAYANSTLRFEVASGALVTNPVTGNVKPGTAIVEISAMLKQKRDPNREVRPGVDTSAAWLEGYVIEVQNAENPILLPSVVTPDSLCEARWAGRSGQFVLTFAGRSPYGVAEIIGDRLKGYFQFNSFTVSGDPWTPIPTPVEGLMKFPFSFGDASPMPVYTTTAGQTVFTAQIVIQVPFNGVGASLSLGDAVVSDRLIRVDQVDPTFAAEYEANPGYTYASATPIILTIVPGAGCTQGSGYILLEV